MVFQILPESAKGKADMYQPLLRMGNCTPVESLPLAGIHGSLRFAFFANITRQRKTGFRGPPLARFKGVDHGDRT